MASTEKRGRHYRTALERAETAVYWRQARVKALEAQVIEYKEKLVAERALLTHLSNDPRLANPGEARCPECIKVESAGHATVCSRSKS